jgi:hypothetical protein
MHNLVFPNSPPSSGHYLVANGAITLDLFSPMPFPLPFPLPIVDVLQLNGASVVWGVS